MKKTLTIIGPTASGKTSLCVDLAQKLNGEVIGLDSRQIYKGMPIGTAQPTHTEMKGIPHHLFGFQDPSKPISAGQYADQVIEKCQQILSVGKTPILCGGAGLYFRALTQGIFAGSVSNLPLRGRLEQAYEDDPVSLYERLQTIDPDYCKIVHINNKKRLVRALEIFEATGISPSEHFRNQKNQSLNILPVFSFLLNYDRSKLVNRIEKRTKEMFAKGWIAEVEYLLKQQNESGQLFPALNSIGYRQIKSYLDGAMSYQEMEEDIVIRTRQYARRQMQWFRKESIDINVVLDHLEISTLPEIVHDIFSHCQ